MKRTSLRRNLGKIALTVTPRPIWNAYLRTWIAADISVARFRKNADMCRRGAAIRWPVH